MLLFSLTDLAVMLIGIEVIVGLIGCCVITLYYDLDRMKIERTLRENGFSKDGKAE